MGKRKKWLWAGGVVLALTLVAVIFLKVRGSKPFENLIEQDLVSASVELTPPGEEVSIENLQEMAEQLKKVVVYRRENSDEIYAGQSVVFEFIMADGTERRIEVCAPFVVIDGVRYQAKYAPCEELNAYADELLKEEATD